MNAPVEEGKTHMERVAEIRAMKLTVRQINRLLLIYRPFPVVRRLGTGSAMPWAGTMVGDTFYGRNEKQYRPAGMTGGGSGDEGVVGRLYEMSETRA